jgi:hypothetical protein
MLIVARTASNAGLTGSRQWGVTARASRIDLRRRVLSVHSMACSAVRRANTACERKYSRVLALIELGLLRGVARSTQTGNFLRTCNTIRRGAAGSFTMLDARAVAGVAA